VSKGLKPFGIIAIKMRNTADLTDGKPIAVHLRCERRKSFSRILRHPWKKRRDSFVVSDTTRDNVDISNDISNISFDIHTQVHKLNKNIYILKIPQQYVKGGEKSDNQIIATLLPPSSLLNAIVLS
jgi:hypothetical protein